VKRIIASVAILFAIGWAIAEFSADNEYSNFAGSYWELSDKASTLQQKTTYLDQYVAALQTPGKFASHDATIYPTPNNSFEQNMIALLSLQGRMHDIQNMDQTSFAYQTAISQITAQEQGEAHGMTSTFNGCWYLQNHYFLWGWHAELVWGLIALTLFVLFVLGVVEISEP
jgi:hypothetical protein